MLNFDFKKNSRKCCESDREFQPGEAFFSVLKESEEGVPQRFDFSSEHWDGPPEDCIGWWKSRIAELGKGRVYWAPKEVLLSFFDHVQANAQTTDIAYVTALLLLQKKILTLEDDGGDASRIAVRSRFTKTSYELAVADISPQRLAEIQEELSERLFMDQPADSDSGLGPDEGD